MIVKNGYVVAEGWWPPYRSEVPQLTYSLSKSVTSTAIGIAQSEGLLSIDDSVVSFFGEKAKKSHSTYLSQLKVRHLLAMSSGHLHDTWPEISAGDSDFVTHFLAIEPDRAPGTTFCYNQGCTYTLSALISRLTGSTLWEYLRPRLFDPLGVTNLEWLTSREGITLGFTGLHLETESIAKFGLVQLHLGEWQGRQVVPADYLAQAHEKQVANVGSSREPDWQQGYGFQFWVCRHGAYRADGAMGQLCVVIPEHDAVVVCTAGTPEGEMQSELDAIWDCLLPGLSVPSEPDALADKRLAQRLDHLASPSLEIDPNVGPSNVVFTRSSAGAPLTEHITRLRVHRSGSQSSLSIRAFGREHSFQLIDGDWCPGTLPGLHTPFVDVSVRGGWASFDRYVLDVVWPASPHRLELRGVLGTTPTFEATWATPPLRGLDSY
ncbi:MAG TPA: serine hydrolase domain-containing protein [Acidimicrobiales bacterium]|nr:serine hydrolase domain-containing protein [Acidimicrobiales bacterium]